MQNLKYKPDFANTFGYFGFFQSLSMTKIYNIDCHAVQAQLAMTVITPSPIRKVGGKQKE